MHWVLRSEQSLRHFFFFSKFLFFFCNYGPFSIRVPAPHFLISSGFRNGRHYVPSHVGLIPGPISNFTSFFNSFPFFIFFLLSFSTLSPSTASTHFYLFPCLLFLTQFFFFFSTPTQVLLIFFFLFSFARSRSILSILRHWFNCDFS